MVSCGILAWKWRGAELDLCSRKPLDHAQMPPRTNPRFYQRADYGGDSGDSVKENCAYKSGWIMILLDLRPAFSWNAIS